MYEFFDHTADLGLHVRAADLDALFADAGRGFSEMLVEDISSIRPVVAEEVRIDGEDRAYLLFDWLRELLVRFETRRMVFSEFDVRVGDAGLVARVRGEPHDPARHPWGHEVKAITYHGLSVEPTPEGWVAEVIVDI